MSISSEAAYLYIYSKELTKLNKQLRGLSRKAEKHAHKLTHATKESKKQKHKIRHGKVKEKIEKIMRRHNHVLKGLKHHLMNFHDAMRRQHKI